MPDHQSVDEQATARAPDHGGAVPTVVQLAIPRHLWIVGALVGLVVLVIAGVVIAQLEDTRRTINTEVAGRLARVQKTTGTIKSNAAPVLRAAQDDRDDARRLTGLSTLLARQATPLAKNLRAADPGRQLKLVGALATDLTTHDAGTQLQKAGNLSGNLLGVNAGAQITKSADLARSLLAANVGPTVADLGKLAATVQTAKLPALSTALTGVTDELSTQDRLRRLLVRLTSVLGQVRTTKLVPKLSTAADAVPKTIVPLLQQTIVLLSDTQNLTRDARDIARDTNKRVINLDRKLGGDLPTP